MIKIHLRLRPWFIVLSFMASFIVLLSSFYFEYVKGLQPCPLCLMQRLSVFLLCIICLSNIFIENLKPARIATSLQFFVAISGLFLQLANFGYNPYLLIKSPLACQVWMY